MSRFLPTIDIVLDGLSISLIPFKRHNHFANLMEQNPPSSNYFSAVKIP
jgi:hypothetical protein